MSPSIVRGSLVLAGLLASGSAFARPNVTGGAALDTDAVPVASSALFTAEMCNNGPSAVGSVFLGAFIPQGLPYRVVGTPPRTSARAVIYAEV